jgi:hypothetical protein
MEDACARAKAPINQMGVIEAKCPASWDWNPAAIVEA